MNEEEMMIKYVEVINRLNDIRDKIIDIDIIDIDVSAGRGIFSEPSHKSLMIKLKYVEDSEIIERKIKYLESFLIDLQIEETKLEAEIKKLKEILNE